jgi:hypothetical protein
MLRWARTLGNGRRRSSWLVHISRLAMRSSFRRRVNPGHWAAPMASDLFRMALRQVRNTFERTRRSREQS